MDIGITGLIVTSLGVVVAIIAWWFPRHSKSTSTAKLKASTNHRSNVLPSDYSNQIEVAFKHLKSTTFDDEKTKYIKLLAKRLDGIELTDLTKLISYLALDENKVLSVKAFSGKVFTGYVASHYETFLNEFVLSESKQKAAAHINQS